MTTTHSSASTSTVADLVRTYPAAVRILQQHGIDFCCGGKRPLTEACAAAGVTTDALLDEVVRAGTTEAVDWSALPLAALCSTIVARFHAPLAGELARLQAMAERVLLVHGHKDPERLEGLVQTLDALVDELLPHLAQEEVNLFAAIQAGQLVPAAVQVPSLEHEHEAVGGILHRLRHLTDGFVPPPGACGTWRALYQGLGELEIETHEHIHVENNVLFPALLKAA